MNSWLTKFRLSAALEAGRTLAEPLRKKMNGSDDLRRFGRDLQALDEALQQAPPAPEVSSSFHNSIMRAVRATTPQPKPSVLRWFPAPALAALAVLLVWTALRQPAPAPVRTSGPNTQPLVAATTVLEMGDLMARTVPAAALSPLSEEWERVNRDMDNTAQFLLASLP
jgi:hypothetical protein